jgi:hypothetical protein
MFLQSSTSSFEPNNPKVIQETEKSDAAKKRKYVAALRAEQRNEEMMGFVRACMDDGMLFCLC